MPTGAYFPGPERTGAARGNTIEAIQASLLAQLGTAYDTSVGSKVWAKAHATARILWEAHETAQRFRNQFDPNRVTDFLSRWEAIFGIAPRPGATDNQRRAALAVRWALIGRPANLRGVTDTIRALLPNTFASIVYTSSATALNHTPAAVVADGGVTTPTGTVTIAAPDPTDPQATTWGSSVHYLAIKTTQPAWMSDADYATEIGGADTVLEILLPMWVTFAIFKDGPSGAGFYLDEPDLDLERFA